MLGHFSFEEVQIRKSFAVLEGRISIYLRIHMFFPHQSAESMSLHLRTNARYVTYARSLSLDYPL